MGIDELHSSTITSGILGGQVHGQWIFFFETGFRWCVPDLVTVLLWWVLHESCAKEPIRIFLETREQWSDGFFTASLVRSGL